MRERINHVGTSQAPPRVGEKVLTFLILLMSTGAFMSLFIAPGQTASDSGSVVGKLVSAVVYLSVFLLLISKCKGFVQEIMHERFIFALLGLAILSTYWSDDPTVSIKRSLELVGTSLFGVYFSIRYDFKEKIRLLAVMCGFSVVWCFIFGILGLGNSVDNIPGAWFGIYVQKNSLGRMMVLSALVFAFFGKVNPQRRGIARLFMGLSFILILLSKSDTALVVLCGLISVRLLLTAFRRSVRLGIAMILAMGSAVGAIGYWVITHAQQTAATLDRSVTLTGRLTVWILCVVMALKRPWLGYGYQAFWEGAKGPSARIWIALNWAAPHSHNGFLDLWLDLGLFGIAIFFVGFTIYVRRAIEFTRKRGPESAWPLMILSFIFLYNLTESTLIGALAFFWVLYTAVAFTLSAETESESPPVRSSLVSRQHAAYGTR
jgi:exopolysaccharide production protein ExoQ